MLLLKTIQKQGKKYKSGYLFNETYTYKVHLICIILHPIWLQWGRKTHEYTRIWYQQKKRKIPFHFPDLLLLSVYD